MTAYRALIEDAVRATTVSRRTYAWFGERRAALPAAVQGVVSPAQAREALVAALQLELYANWYCTGAAIPAPRTPSSGSVKGATPFVQALSAANAGRGVWDAGWTVAAVVDDGALVLRRGGLELRTPPDLCQLPSDAPAAPDTHATLWMPNELLGISPGFYMVVSDCPFRPEDGAAVVRLYWHLTPDGAVAFVRCATSRLNRAGVPFRLKVVNDPARYRRCDAGVLYVFRHDYERVATILGDIHAAVAHHLHAATPALTKRLAPGVGLAEEVGAGETSFGMHRARLLADGLVRAHEQRRRGLAARVDAVVARFAEDGVSLDAPFLNPGSQDGYRSWTVVASVRERDVPAAPARTADPLADVLLCASAGIGERLARDAYWHEEACTWLGAEATDAGEGGRGPYATLGPDLYGGTAGVAVYLAALAAATGASDVRRTAFGALHHAVACLDVVLPAQRRAFYTGWTGIAFAAAYVGTTLQEPVWVDRARELLDRALGTAPVAQGFDLLSGTAGTIVAVLRLNARFQDPALLDAAASLGDQLLATADVDRGASSWSSPGFSTQRNLTGFSHGTAGIGYALLELHGATGDRRYRVAAESAFEYERQSFDRRAGNWPDFRKRPGARGGAGRRFGTFWCHGAPGIALSRLRAFQLLHDERCRAEALVALGTTAAEVAMSLRANVGNFSLCHGLTGNAEILRYGQRILGRTLATVDTTLPQQVAAAGIARHVRSPQPWPCGTSGGETAGFMLGLAGIGSYYLQLSGAPTVPLLMP